MATIPAIARRPTRTLGRDIPGVGCSWLARPTSRFECAASNVIRDSQRRGGTRRSRGQPRRYPWGLPTVRTDPGTCHLATTLSHGTKVAAGR